ncbi:5-formyltetrahydrofolate cyclo-ligase [Candidatus Micrarchaeota archaeon]|nr:5-formyltetrahydrofolate cyclo-ligase [Candidatus Micrarchaeota archaeon]
MVAEAKERLRRNVLAIRDSLSPEEAAEASAAIGQSLFTEEHFKNAKTVAFYLAKGNEVDTKGMIERAMREGKGVLVPITNEEITMCGLSSLSDLVPGKFGVPEPKTRKQGKHPPEVVIAPGVVFGLCMHRIGYGKSYYDRYFKKNTNAFKIGICFDFQVMEELPRHEHDVAMDLIITDKRLIKQGGHSIER